MVPNGVRFPSGVCARAFAGCQQGTFAKPPGRCGYRRGGLPQRARRNFSRVAFAKPPGRCGFASGVPYPNESFDGFSGGGFREAPWPLRLRRGGLPQRARRIFRGLSRSPLAAAASPRRPYPNERDGFLGAFAKPPGRCGFAAAAYPNERGFAAWFGAGCDSERCLCEGFRG